jgi:YVTN family beta-propeller protein
VSEEAGLLFVTSEASGYVTVVDTGTRDVLGRFKVGAAGGPFDIAVDWTARKAYVVGAKDQSIAVLDLESLGVAEMLQPDENHPGAFGFTVAVDPGRDLLFVGSRGPEAGEWPADVNVIGTVR